MTPGSAAWAQTAGEPAEEEALRVTEAGLERVLTDGSTRPVDLGCTARSALRHEDLWYVACRRQLLTVELAGGEVQVRGRTAIDGEARELFVRGGQVWVELARIEARPVPTEAIRPPASAVPTPAPRADSGSPGGSLHEPPPPPGTRPPAPPGAGAPAATPPEGYDRPAVGAVVERRPGAVVVSLGSADSVARGDRVGFFQPVTEDPDAEWDAGREELVVVGTVSGVASDRSRVQLGINERVPVDASVRVVDRAPTGSSVAPPRLGGVTEVGFLLRPFLPVDSLGIGILGEAYVGHWLEGPFHVGARLDPMGIAIVRGEEAGVAAGHAFGAVDLGIVEVGLGAGWSTFNEHHPDQTDAPSILQLARLGARDGLHLAGRVAFLVIDDRFVFSSTDIQVQFPFYGVGGQPTWGIVRGGGGAPGYYFGEVGLRVLMSGNGDRGSTFLTLTLGGGAVWDEDAECPGSDPSPGCWAYDSQTYAGPMAGVGLEWRL